MLITDSWLDSPDWPGTHYIDQTNLQLKVSALLLSPSAVITCLAEVN